MITAKKLFTQRLERPILPAVLECGEKGVGRLISCVRAETGVRLAFWILKKKKQPKEKLFREGREGTDRPYPIMLQSRVKGEGFAIALTTNAWP